MEYNYYYYYFYDKGVYYFYDKLSSENVHIVL